MAYLIWQATLRSGQSRLTWTIQVAYMTLFQIIAMMQKTMTNLLQNAKLFVVVLGKTSLTICKQVRGRLNIKTQPNLTLVSVVL